MDTNRRMWIWISIFAISALIIGACSGTTPPQASGDGSARVDEVDEHMNSDEPMHDEHMEDNHHEDEHVGDEHHDDEHMDGEHHADHMHHDVPSAYEDLVNPFGGDPQAIDAGAELFAVNCASCHGNSGMGDGPAAAGLDPKPAPLADGGMMSDLSDAYVFWRITEGGLGEPFNSAMPPWGEAFSAEQRWQLVSFVRSLAQ